MQLPTSSGSHPINVAIVSSEQGEPPSEQRKMNFSHTSQLKSTGSCMSNKQLKAITQVVRKVGITCPSMSMYYIERHIMCDEIFECVRISLDFSKEKYTSDFRDTWVVRCSNIDVLLEKVYNSCQVSVHDLHFRIGLDYGQSFTKLVLRLQQENSVNH